MSQTSRPVQVRDGTLCRAATPLPRPVGVSTSPVAHWSVRTRLLEAARRAGPKLPAESRQQFEALFSPTNIKITGGVLGLWGASHLVGVGEAVDVVLTAVGVATLGVGAFGAGRDLGTYLTLAANARTEADLDRAAGHLARAVVTMGVVAFGTLILKAGNRLGGRAGVSGQAGLELDVLSEEMLQRLFGSSKNVGTLPRQNVRTIVAFFQRFNVKGGDLTEWANLIKGIDLHASEPVRVVRLEPGELVGEYVELARPANRQVGQWMVRARGAVSHRNLGLSGAGRAWKVFRVTGPVDVLESRAAPAADFWTEAGPRPHTAVTTSTGGQRALLPAEQVAGGGKQYFLPRAWDFLVEVEGETPGPPSKGTP